jgi:hypothetical protein
MDHQASPNGRRDQPSYELCRDPWGRLVFIDGSGEEHIGIEVVRGFPISDPAGGISLCDSDGHELVWIDNLAGLPGPVRQLIEEELARREFVPVIRQIVKVSSPVEPSEWEVDTDRGRTSFVLNSEDSVRRLDGQRAIITDALGIRYLIPDLRLLNAGSRRILERYL